MPPVSYLFRHLINVIYLMLNGLRGRILYWIFWYFVCLSILIFSRKIWRASFSFSALSWIGWRWIFCCRWASRSIRSRRSPTLSMSTNARSSLRIIRLVFLPSWASFRSWWRGLLSGPRNCFLNSMSSAISTTPRRWMGWGKSCGACSKRWLLLITVLRLSIRFSTIIRTRAGVRWC